ncbi:MAG: GH92 family glycosyl hydrolase [Myxococcota bacterium]
MRSDCRPRPVLLGVVLLGALLGVSCSSSSAPPGVSLPEVDPFIGAGGLGYGVGSVPPGPTYPQGMVKPGPDTSKNGGAPGFAHCAGYWWEDDEIRGFSQMHLSGTGVPDYGVVMLMPLTVVPPGPIVEESYRARYDHHAESAKVGEYGVTLIPSGIKVRIGAAPHSAFYRIQYPDGAPASLIFSLAHGLSGGVTKDGSIQIDADKKEVHGFIHHVGNMSGRFGGYRLYYVMRFDRALSHTETFAPGKRLDAATSTQGPDVGAILGFGEGGALNVEIGLSFLDEAGARRNLEVESVGFDLDEAVRRAENAWAPILNQIVIEGGDKDERRTFYSALYRAHHMPDDLTDVDGRFIGIDQKPGKAEGWTYYSNLSMWDTFRTLHPLYTLLSPALERDICRTLVTMTNTGGAVPRWPLAVGETWTMIGSHGESVAIDSWVKGVRDFDAEGLFQKVWPAVHGPVSFLGEPHASRECIQGWTQRGYCAADADGGGTVSRTLENSYNDWLLAQLARGLGHPSEATELEGRAAGWQHLYDAGSGYLRPHNADGSMPQGFDAALFADDYTEGNARQWLPYVPHDIPGLAEKAGGVTALASKLDEFFTQAAAAEKTPLPDVWYWHGNEPDIHTAYMFMELGRPDLTQKWVSWIMSARYAATPAGLDGNDDGGTLSAWYVFSALGIYPKVGTTQYYLGLPRFPKATITLGDKTLTIVRQGDAAAQKVSQVRFNDQVIEGPFVEHQALLGGGTLVFQME